LDTNQVVARFEAERQALAMMDHPNIAKVLDAGTTDSGRPYFVMELVRGIPITQFCDEQQMSTQRWLAYTRAYQVDARFGARSKMTPKRRQRDEGTS
jgi:serine/threonine protein kinase